MDNNISCAMQEKLMDIKSKATYDKWWNHFTEYCQNYNKDMKVYANFLDYIGFLSNHYKYSTLWQASSCINKFVKLKFGMDFIKEASFKMLMKNLGKAYKPNKSSIFTLDDVVTCMVSTELDILVKASVIIGVYGGLRIAELVNLEFEDVAIENGVFKVNIKQSKTDPAGTGHCFCISPSADIQSCPVSILKLYIDLFEVKDRCGRFFRYVKNGKGTMKPVGKNTLASYPKKCASFLGKEMVDSFTGHCFRGTSATILADSGASLLALKRHGRWKSDVVATSYVRDSKKSKMEVAQIFSRNSVSTSLSTANSSGAATAEASARVSSGSFDLQNCVFNNCVVHMNSN